MIAVIDYGVGNLFSISSSLKTLGADVKITGNEEILKRADKIILPGVGAFRDAMSKLSKTGLDKVIYSEAEKGKPIMGICLGMQLLFEKSYEYGIYQGLGLISGNVKPITDVISTGYSIPHIGWNSLDIVKNSPILKYVRQGDYVYFVHSYYATDCDEFIIASSNYGAPLTAAVQRENIFGCQFHPEKSGECGLKILKAFLELRG